MNKPQIITEVDNKAPIQNPNFQGGAKIDNKDVITKDITDSLSNQITVLQGDISKRQIRTYISLSQLGLTDAQFSGLTQVQAFDLLINAMGRYSQISLLLTSANNNLRTSVMGEFLDTKFPMHFTLYVGDSSTYNVTCLNQAKKSLFGCGGIGAFSGWSFMANTEKIDILNADLKNGWVNSIYDDGGKVELLGSSVHLSLTLLNGTTLANTIIMNLPKFRPTKRQSLTFDCFKNDGTVLGIVYATLSNNGDVTLTTQAPTGTTMLSIKCSYIL